MEQNQHQERTEQATPKRLKEAREKGQIPRSRELNTLGVMLASAGGLMLMGEHLGSGISGLMKEGLSYARNEALETSYIAKSLSELLLNGLLALAPFFAIVVLAAIASPLMLGGWSFSVKALAFKAEKLNPIKGLKRLFGLRGLLEMLKAIAKFLLVGTAAVFWLWYLADDFLSLSRQPILRALTHAAHLCVLSLVILSSVLVIIAAVDVPFQLWDHAKQLRMTKQEVRDEFKETEGKPEVKSRIRAAQQEIAQRRMMEEVPKADVIVTNPTHFAVALKYDAERMKAPRVVAKGVDLVAARIRNLAAENNVPIFSAPPLARALYRSTDLGKEIPAKLYAAVAQVLSYVYQLKQAENTAGMRPPAPPEIDEDLID